MTRPEHSWPLRHSHLTAAGPPSRSLDASRHNLPLQLTPLVGRSDDVRRIVKELDSARLITITGPGGVGKTRLALQVAADGADAYPDGVWFFEFASTGDEIGVLSTITSVLRMPATGVSGASGLVEHLCEQLQPRQALLVFDNCEHVVEIVARLTHTLLGRCPTLVVVATSRELLRISGEEAFPLSPLPVPAPDVTDPVAVQSNAAVSLFYDRARAAQPLFVLDQSTASAVVAICRRLDGIPLALELAAARLRVLTVRQIADHLDDCFGVLVGGARTVPRQQTLQATLDWSYELLTPGEQTALRRLAVFPDWFRLDAAIAVTTGGTGGDRELNIAAQLVDKSLVVADSTGHEVRYRLLEPVRQYGHRKLTEAGEAELAACRHRDFFLSHAAMRGRAITPFMVADYANFRAALAWSWERGGIDSSRALVELGSASRIVGLVDGRQWLERVLSPAGAVDRPERAQALVQLALITHESGQPDEAREKALTEEAIAIAHRLDDAELWARLAYPLAELNLAWGRPQEARATLLRGVSFYSEIDSRLMEGWCHDLLGWVDVTEGQFEGARTHFGRAADLAEDGDDGGWLAAHALADLAPVTVLLGDAQEGSELARRALAASAAVGVLSVTLMALERAVETALLADDVRTATTHATELLRLLRGQHGRRWVADALENAALRLRCPGVDRTGGQSLGGGPRRPRDLRRAAGGHPLARRPRAGPGSTSPAFTTNPQRAGRRARRRTDLAPVADKLADCLKSFWARCVTSGENGRARSPPGRPMSGIYTPLRSRRALFGVVPTSEQRRLFRCRDCSDLGVDSKPSRRTVGWRAQVGTIQAALPMPSSLFASEGGSSCPDRFPGGVEDPSEVLLEAFIGYLRSERGVSELTVEAYVEVRRFLAGLGGRELSALTAADVSSSVLGEVGHRSPATVRR